MRYFLHYDETGTIIGAPFCDLVHGIEKPFYNTEPITDQVPETDEEGNPVIDDAGNTVMKTVTVHEAGTVQTGTTIDLSGIPTPNIEITEAEHDEWMQHQGERKVDVATGKLVEYTPPGPTDEEKKAQALADLDAEYQPQFSSLAQALGLATLDGNQANIDSIKEDYAALKEEYQTKREAISNG